MNIVSRIKQQKTPIAPKIMACEMIINKNERKKIPMILQKVLKLVSMRTIPKRNLRFGILKYFVAIGPIHAPIKVPMSIVDAIVMLTLPFKKWVIAP